MRARIVSLKNEVLKLKGLESEVKQLKNLIETRDLEITARNWKITEGQIQLEALCKWASETENQRVEALVQLADEDEAMDNLAVELGSSRAWVAMLESDLTAANTTKAKAEAYKKLSSEL